MRLLDTACVNTAPCEWRRQKGLEYICQNADVSHTLTSNLQDKEQSKSCSLRVVTGCPLPCPPGMHAHTHIPLEKLGALPTMIPLLAKCLCILAVETQRQYSKV